MARTKRQFGIGLEVGTELINLGLGPGNRPLKGLGQGFLEPTRIMYGERETVNLLGVELNLIAAPGESPRSYDYSLARAKVYCSVVIIITNHSLIYMRFVVLVTVTSIPGPIVSI